MSTATTSTASKDMADRLGQSIFRIETNMTLLGRKLQGGEVLINEAVKAVMRDVEALKVLKDELTIDETTILPPHHLQRTREA